MCAHVYVLFSLALPLSAGAEVKGAGAEVRGAVEITYTCSPVSDVSKQQQSTTCVHGECVHVYLYAGFVPGLDLQCDFLT